MGEWTNRINGKIDFEIYELVSETALQIFEEITRVARDFPNDKIYLADLVCRHSKLVCTNLEEAWRMKESRNAFVDKLSDAAQAASKTQDLLKFASANNYMDRKIFEKIDTEYENIFEDIFSILCDSEKMIDHHKNNGKRVSVFPELVSIADQFPA